MFSFATSRMGWSTSEIVTLEPNSSMGLPKPLLVRLGYFTEPIDEPTCEATQVSPVKPRRSFRNVIKSYAGLRAWFFPQVQRQP